MNLSSFSRRLDKIALALMSNVEAKNSSVKAYGIGEDLSINLFCWRADSLKVMLQLRPEMQKADPVARFEAISNAACVTRRGWGIDAFTMTSEAYVSDDPILTKGVELKEAYINPEYKVNECLTVMHVEDGHSTFVAKPYTYDVPRKVIWGDEKYHPGGTMVRNQDGMYPKMFHRVLTKIDAEEIPERFDVFHEALFVGLNEAGFYCQSFD